MKVEVRNSKIQGRGVYATKDIKKGEVIIVWHPKKVINLEELEKLSEEERDHTHYIGGGKYFLMGEPERFVNHSCNPNSFIGPGYKDIALKEIRKGEEITSDYSIGGTGGRRIKCSCGSNNCRKILDEDFFKLPKEIQRKYYPFLEEWFKKEFNDRLLR